MKVYHAGYDEIKVPDIHRGRVNADFGQGFYLSDNREFSSLWVREKKGSEIITGDVIKENRELTAGEQDEYLREFAEVMQGLLKR